MLVALLMVSLTPIGAPSHRLLPPPAATVQTVGLGYPPPRMSGARGRLMARRAAEVVAVRNLAAKLGIGPQGRLPAFRYVSTKHLPNGSVEVTVETTVPFGRNTTTLPTPRNGAHPRRPAGGRH